MPPFYLLHQSKKKIQDKFFGNYGAMHKDVATLENYFSSKGIV